MAIILGGLTLDHVLNWLDEKSTEVAEEEFVNKSTPTVDDDIWSNDAKIIVIVCREEDDDKWTIESTLTGAMTTLVQGENSWDVWILRIESEYDGDTNSEKPWKMKITMIVDD